MQDTSKNKMIGGEKLEEYFFAGGLEYQPMTIRAKNLGDAEKEWEEKKKPVQK